MVAVRMGSRGDDAHKCVFVKEKVMQLSSVVGNSFGCSASGERLVSAARDGDFQEAKALLEYNPRLAKYSTFGARNSPLHHSAAQGHHEIVSLLIESGVDINLRNYRGQTALMQACQYDHWEVVLTLVLFKANIHKTDFLNGGTALHLAALNGNARCIRILLADYIPSNSKFYKLVKRRLRIEEFVSESNERNSLSEIINRHADGGVTALHMATLNGHVDSLHLLLDLGASVNEVTVEDGTTIDLIGAGSTPLHYAAYGGNPHCCQLLIARGASLTAENAKGRSPLEVAHSWHRNWLEDILSAQTQNRTCTTTLPSPYLCLPLMSVVKVARECGWRSDLSSKCADPCVVCLENKCTVAASGCLHELCTGCALYLCSTSNTSSSPNGPPGSIPCPLCRHRIVSFKKLTTTKPLMQSLKPSSSLSCCPCSSMPQNITRETTPLCNPKLTSQSFSSITFPSLKLKANLCMRGTDTISSLIRRSQLIMYFESVSRNSADYVL